VVAIEGWRRLVPTADRRRGGFTLVELLVVIAIVGVLVALLLPAVQAAREAARRSHCTNNLKQLGIASQLHVDARGFFPSAGWGDWWVGCPDQGAGKSQPGSWAYQLLPFIEESARAQVGRGYKCSDANSKAAMGKMVGTAVTVFYCPTRRAAQGYPWTNQNNTNFDPPENAGRSDYAGNIGGAYANLGIGTDVGPLSLDAAGEYNWRYSGNGFLSFWKSRYPAFDGMTGVIFQRSEIKLRQITDGTTHTYLLGEKNLDPEHYEDGLSGNDDQSMYNGYDKDNVRAADIWLPGFENQGAPIRPPAPDTPGVQFDWSFGGPHVGGWMALFCDGSVRQLSFDMAPELHQFFGTRNDGSAVDAGGM
jgi:prepilin-type N-terminal cleavage/methylation domain-containing protein